ncbi:hypothetical protein [Azospirillum griseum]|uniref:Uncharacterized protein n=1 Tax=Azospirillum griseum TaxID=2496639 RepID=A0A431V9H3_9PROT|nr:hypothetical protein [Azospirillum griseum]RTR11226.1 hypothetical protein EJ903_26140 [Azospirillum griseum]
MSKNNDEAMVASTNPPVEATGSSGDNTAAVTTAAADDLDREPIEGVDFGTHDAYLWGEWKVLLEIASSDWAKDFEVMSPPSFVIYAFMWRKGTYVGKVDMLTRLEIRGSELWLTDFHIHGHGGRALRGVLSRSGLNALCNAAKEDTNVEAVVIEGGVRSQGLRRGQVPERFRFDGGSGSTT